MDDEGLKNGGTVLTKDCFLLECKTSFIVQFTERQWQKFLQNFEKKERVVLMCSSEQIYQHASGYDEHYPQNSDSGHLLSKNDP